MRTVQTQVFTYSELSEDAKEKAREWYRRSSQDDNFYAEYVYQDAATIADLMGIDLCKTRTNDGKYKPTIYYSGFWSQGCGSSFECSYKYKKGAVNAVKAYAPQDNELHRIAQSLQDTQKKHFYQLRASSKVRGHYVHSGCMDIDVYCYGDQCRDIGIAEDTIAQSLRDFANWIYKHLEQAYDYENSDDNIVETIICNEYEFTEDGVLV